VSRERRGDLGRSLFPPPGKTHGRARAIHQINRSARLAAKAAPRPHLFAAGEDWRNGAWAISEQKPRNRGTLLCRRPNRLGWT